MKERLTAENIEAMRVNIKESYLQRFQGMLADNYQEPIDELCDLALQSLASTAAQGGEPVLREPLKKFVDAMEMQLKANDHRGGWKDCKPGYLHQRIELNLSELGTHRADKNWVAYYRTCVDVANFAMMLADNAPHPPAQRAEGGEG